MWCGISGSEMRFKFQDEPAVFATKQRPFIAEEALPVVDYALVFPPGLLKKTGEASDLLFVSTDAELADVFRLRAFGLTPN